MIEISGVSRRYPDGREALRGVNLNVATGEMLFLGGPSGAGKTTLLRLVAGIDRPSRGSIRLNGQELTRLRLPALEALRRKIGLVFQEHRLLFDRSVRENAALPLRIQGMTAPDIERRVGAALERVGLAARAKDSPWSLSGGERQRLCIARALVGRPALILADEPTGNLDHEYGESILTLFRSFHLAGVTLVVATHDERLVTRLEGRLVHMDNGQIVRDGARAA
ncbi:MAG: ATP-binding cassette domain-containing protein [Pseudomonadota bacterium]|nr:ATP-binding cassette domain-containing protein [Pseudomonadota bacterium]